MSHPTPDATFQEADFELLANAIDTIAPEKRELFLAKLTILLIANLTNKEALPDWVARAKAHLDLA